MGLIAPLLGPILQALFKELLSGFFRWLDTRQAIDLGRAEAAAKSSEAAREKEAEYAEIAARPVTHDDLLGRLRNGTF